ncbi:DNA-binding protein [Candidatus Acetothermia bacterium]|nr:DNA-binding protein [Candidatus Acetothermia bacterium]
MTTIKITLSEDRLRRLNEVASRFGIAPEELARLSIEEWLARPDEEFQQTVNRVLQKNAELYRRLA